MKSSANKIFLPLILVYIVLNGVMVVFKGFLENHGFDIDFLIIANLLLFLLSLAGFFFQRRGLQSPNPNAFVRYVYGAILIKLFVCIIAFTAYAFIQNKNINRPGIFLSMGLYAVYTTVEVASLMKAVRKRDNG